MKQELDSLNLGQAELPVARSISFIIRAVGDGGTVCESDKPSTLAALELGLRKWFNEQEIEDD